jgi:hypothetical protein
MKKTFVTCLAIVALLAVASSASAIVCTIDQRPAATLLVPYFQVNINSDGSLATGGGALTTLLTIANTSSAPMIAHVNVFSERSELVLDFNIALTGFDVQSMDLGRVLQGNLPATPVASDHSLPDVTDISQDPCQRNTDAAVFPQPDGFLRVRNNSNGNPGPGTPADPNDNTLATTLYPTPAWTAGGTFYNDVIGSLDSSRPSSRACSSTGHVDPPFSGPLQGYITIDHANYCNLSSPNFASYYFADAIGNENNLVGEVIFVAGSGTQTQGISTVNIEASSFFSSTNNGGYFDQSPGVRERTFYARYWSPTTEQLVDANNNLSNNPWDFGFGDEREPLGLKFAARYFEGNGIQSYLRVWRASSGVLTDLLDGGDCDTVEPTVNLVFYDEDENTISQPGQPPCPSPCTTPPPSTYNFPYETQRVRANSFSLPAATNGAQVGWVSASFVNKQFDGPTGDGTANNNGMLDQAWMDYEFIGAGAFINAGLNSSQLDPTTCQPLILGNTSLSINIQPPPFPVGYIPGGPDGQFCCQTWWPPVGTGP